MTRRLASILEEKLSLGDEALGALEKYADQGDAQCRDAYIELGDKLGWKGIVATKLVTWYETAPTNKRNDAFRRAFDRFAEIGREKDAARAAVEPLGQLATMPAIAESRWNLTRARTFGPATASSASSICCTVQLMAGRLSAVRPQKASRLAS